MSERVNVINLAASNWIYRPIYTWAKRLRYAREFQQYVVRWASGQALTTEDALERDLIFKLHCFAEDTRTEQQRLVADEGLTIDDATFPDFDTYVAPDLPTFWSTGIVMSRIAGLTSALTERPTAAEVDSQIQAIVGAAPAALNTLQEIAVELENNQSGLEALMTAIGLKADAAALGNLISSLAIIATTGDYNDLVNPPIFSEVALSGSYNDLLNKPTIPAASTVAVNSPLTNSGTSTAANLSIPAATTSAAGHFSAVDKTKLNSLVAPSILNITIPDNGTGSAATYTLTATASAVPNRTFAFVTCADPQGATITLSEIGMVQGSELYITNTGSVAFIVTDTAGISESSGNFTVGPNDCIIYMYGVDRFHEVSRSNN